MMARMKELLSPPEFEAFLLEIHQTMVYDRERVRLFDEALAEMIRPGDTVIDVGSGTGILSFLAWRRGAGRVVGIERSEIVETARRTKAEIYPDAPIEFLRLDVERGRLPELQADVVVCELIGNLGPEERIVPVLSLVRKKLLRRGGRLIPSRVRLYAAPVTAPKLYRRLTSWTRRVRGIELTPFQELAWNRAYHLDTEKVSLLAEGRVMTEMNLARLHKSPRRMRCAFELETAGDLHGIVTWLEADLSPGVTLSTSPEARATHWGQVFFPTGPTRPLERGTQISFDLRVFPGDFEIEWRWTVGVGRGRRREERRYTARGQG